MPNFCISNKNRVEDDVMEEILQDPAWFEEVLRERGKATGQACEEIRLASTFEAEWSPTVASGWLVQEKTGGKG